MKKNITYTLTLSKVFPNSHPRHGQPTEFRNLYEAAIKLHTIRANFPLWKDRYENIFINEAVLSLRQWSGKPYHSKQELITNLSVSDKIGLQELVFVDGNIVKPHIIREANLFNHKRQLIPIDVYDLAVNDGLSIEDWLAWFLRYDLNQSFAILHFTEFRYT